MMYITYDDERSEDRYEDGVIRLDTNKETTPYPQEEASAMVAA